MTKSVALVIPCYNESQRFDNDAFVSALERFEELSLVLVDDGSTDRTLEMLRVLERSYQHRCSVLSLDQNQGKAEAVRRGLRAALETSVDVVGYCDADLATPIELLIEMATHFEGASELDVVLGSRVRLLGYEIDRNEFRHYVGRVFATFASLALRVPVYDTQCGAKLLRSGEWLRSMLEKPFRCGWAFDIELLSRYLVACEREQRAARILEHPLRSWSDVPGSKVKLLPALKACVSIVHIARLHRAGMRHASNSGVRSAND